MQELERVKIYIRKVNAAEQVPTDRIILFGNLLMVGNLVVDKPAAQRMILHSIPKKQIVPNPNNAPNSNTAKINRTASAGQKRVVQEISSDSSSGEEGEIRPAKKSKNRNCKLPRGTSNGSGSHKSHQEEKEKGYIWDNYFRFHH
jgi:hypothetical protein